MTTTKTKSAILVEPIDFIEPVESIESIEEVKEIERDRFCSTEFLDPAARLPRIQALRGMDSNFCGYFININELARSGWKPEIENLIEYTYENSNNKEKGILIKTPRMLVCPKSPIMGWDRKQTQETEQLVLKGPWDKQTFRDDPNIGNVQIFEVLLLDKDNVPLHNVPFSYIAKGANQASFAINWQKLVQQVTNCHALANKIPAKPKNLKFQSLCVFAFETKRELAGTTAKSPACKVVAFEEVNINNWKNYFVGQIADEVWEQLTPPESLEIKIPLLTESKEELAETIDRHIQDENPGF